MRTVNPGTALVAVWKYEYSRTKQLLSIQNPKGERVIYEYKDEESIRPIRSKMVDMDGKEIEKSTVGFDPPV